MCVSALCSQKFELLIFCPITSRGWDFGKLSIGSITELTDDFIHKNNKLIQGFIITDTMFQIPRNVTPPCPLIVLSPVTFESDICVSHHPSSLWRQRLTPSHNLSIN